MNVGGFRAIAGRRGIALQLVLVIILLLGALGTTLVFLSRLDGRLRHNSRTRSLVMAAADAAVLSPHASWNSQVYNSLSVGDSLPLAATLEPYISVSGLIVRKSKRIFLVTARVSLITGSAERRRAVLMQLLPLPVQIEAALLSFAPLGVDSNARIKGFEGLPVGPGCSANQDTLPAVIIRAPDPESAIRECGGFPCMVGLPDLVLDTSDARDPARLAGIDLSDLKARATHQISGQRLTPRPRVLGGTCVTASVDNWGDPYVPSLPCGDYFPVVFVSGDLEVFGGRGQGILVVDGDLTIRGRFDYRGVVLITGALRAQAARGQIVGGVVLGGAGDLISSVGAGMAVHYSRCVVQRVSLVAGTGRIVAERGWVQLF